MVDPLRTIDPDKAKAASTVELSDLTVGQSVSGRIRRVEAFGVFVDLAGCGTAGLAHVSELSDKKVKDIHAMFRPGQAVRAKVSSEGQGRHDSLYLVLGNATVRVSYLPVRWLYAEVIV